MPRIERIALPGIAPGTERALTVFRYGAAGARPRVYLQASLHADELPGMMVAHHLRGRLDAAETDGRIAGEIVLLPVANPIGLAQSWHGIGLGRFAFDEGGNFNRDYPDLSEAAIARLEGRFTQDRDENDRLVRETLAALVAELPVTSEVDGLKRALMGLAVTADVVLDLHCDAEALMHVYTSFAGWEHGAARDLARDAECALALLADASGVVPFDEVAARPWNALIRHYGGTPLELGNWGATLEYRGRADATDALGARDAANLERFLTRIGALSGAAGDFPAGDCLACPLDGMDILRSPASGLVAHAAALGATLAPGDLVCEIVDPLAADHAASRIEIRARNAGILYARVRTGDLARPGTRLAALAGETTLAKTGNLLSD
jgi:predicted deacylase